MKPLHIAGAAFVAAAAGFYFFIPGAEQASAPALEGDALVAVTMPTELSGQATLGQNAFNGVCAKCHGQNGVGRKGMGPPLIHKIYEPSHHGDAAFQLAVQNGVRAHHWQFGNMPPQTGLTPSDIANIVAFVREVQRENGIN